MKSTRNNATFTAEPPASESNDRSNHRELPRCPTGIEGIVLRKEAHTL